MIAALFVQPKGCYAGLPEVDPWDEVRDARLYAGPHPVVAHPPCARWSRYWSGGPSARVRRTLGDDDGCFAAARCGRARASASSRQASARPRPPSSATCSSPSPTPPPGVCHDRP